MINYIETLRRTDAGEWMSPKHAALQIFTLARPLMEAVRLTHYNISLSEANVKMIMNLRAESLDTTYCSVCARKTQHKIGPLWTTHYSKPSTEQTTHVCHEHMLIEYEIQHELQLMGARSRDDSQQKSQLTPLLNCCVDSIHFLKLGFHMNTNKMDWDPFVPFFKTFLNEENEICLSQCDHQANLTMKSDLQNTLEQYENLLCSFLKSNQKSRTLDDIYRCIKWAQNEPIIKVQLNAINQTREKMMKMHEKEVPMITRLS